MEPNFYAQNEMIWASLKTIKLKKKKTYRRNETIGFHDSKFISQKIWLTEVLWILIHICRKIKLLLDKQLQMGLQNPSKTEPDGFEHSTKDKLPLYKNLN